MASLILPSRFTQQPQYHCGPAKSDFNRNLAFLWTARSGLITPDFGPTLGLSGGIELQASRHGIGAQLDASEYLIGPASTSVVNTSDGSGTGNFTVAVLHSFGTNVAVRAIAAQRSNTASGYNQFAIQANANAAGFASSGSLQFATYSGAYTAFAVGGAIDGQHHLVFMVRSGSSLIGYQDGVSIGSTSGTVRNVKAADSRFALGIAPPTFNTAGSGSITFSAAWDRALSEEEVKEISANPWQIFRAKPRVLYFDVGGGPGGTLAATESGSDTAALTGVVLVSGTIASTESGSDTASIAGDVLVSGALAATESGSDTAAFTGSASTIVTGSLAATESGADTASLTGDVLVTGSLAVSESGSDAASMAGAVLVQGSIAATESGSDTAFFNASSAVIATGALAAVESGSDVAAITGKVVVAGAFSASESGQDSASVVGTVLVLGELAASEVDVDTASFSGSALLDITGTLAAVETGLDTALFTSVQAAAVLSVARSTYSNTQTARRSNTQTARRPQ